LKIRDVNHELTRIYDDLIDTAEGAHWALLVDEFNRLHPDARTEIGVELFADSLKTKALAVMSAADRAGRVQLELPGISADWDATVTLPDGEGSYRRKRLERATRDDLIADLAIHRENVDRAQSALRRAVGRNDALVSLMAKFDFATAGEAIEYLSGEAG
jgi:hypothetical protein